MSEAARLVAAAIGLGDDMRIIIGSHTEPQKFLRLPQFPCLEFFDKHIRHSDGAASVALGLLFVANRSCLRNRSNDCTAMIMHLSATGAS